MASKKKSAPRTLAFPVRALPGRPWAARASLLLLALCGTTLVIMSKTGNPAAARLRAGMEDALSPLLSVAARPLDALSDAGHWLGDAMKMQAENVALKNENVQLLQWQETAHQMQAENTALRQLLHVVPEEKKTHVTARIVSDAGGPYMRSALLNGGSADGIKKDQAVINGGGLVGRVIEVGQSSARVLLLNDINSRVPVISEQSRQRSILTGNNGEHPTLSYLTTENKVQLGERIVTSGDGGIFPAGIPVGVVVNLEPGAISVQPFVDAPSLEYVSAIDYSL